MVLIISIIILLVGINLFLLFTLKKESCVLPDTPEEFPVSVVIAAKNEFENIVPLIDSLRNLNYPKDKFEVIIVDDNSADGTFEMIQNVVEPEDNISVIKALNKKYPGKKGALELGISKANYDYILITDADCQPENDWIDSFIKKFSEGFDLVFGQAPFFENNTLVNRISRFENLRSSILTFSLCRSGFPYSAAARNFGFTKAAYLAVKGYENTLETASGDDDLFIREAVKINLRIGCVICDNSFVFSETERTLKDYLNQKARHTSTSNHYLLKHKLFLAGWHFINLISLFSLPFSFFYFPLIYLAIIKLFGDIIVCSIKKKMFGYKFNPLEILYLQIFYEIFIVINYFSSFGKNDKW